MRKSEKFSPLPPLHYNSGACSSKAYCRIRLNLNTAALAIVLYHVIFPPPLLASYLYQPLFM